MDERLKERSEMEMSHINQEDHFEQQELLEYKEGLGKFQQKMPELVHAYHQFTERCFEEGEIPQKYKHLIALGISLYAQDEYCIRYHTKGCLDQGCSESEMLELIGVCAALGGGVAMSQGVQLVKNQFHQPTTIPN